MMRWTRFVAALAVLIIAAGPIFAAIYGTAKIVVMDDDGTRIPGATITLSSPVQIGTRVVVTETDGEALVSGLVPGTYAVEVALEGFQPASYRTKISSNETTELLATLTVSALSEAITVTAEAPIVETKNATVAEHVTLEEVQTLPVGRDYRAYAQLVSGVNVVPNASGLDTAVDPAGKGGTNYADRGNEGRTGKAGSRDNTYYIDGLNVTDIGNGTGSMTFNNGVILEQEVITSGVPAEYQGGKGFIGNVITKSGGNDFSGSLNYFFQTADMYEGFDTNDTRLEAPQEDKYDTAATLGGPIVRDRAWFFISGQLRDLSDDVELSSSASPTPQTSEYSLERSNYFAKVMLKASESTTIMAQAFSDPRDTLGSRDVNLPPNRYYKIEDTPETQLLSLQQIVVNNLLIDARYGHFEEDYLQKPLHPEEGPQNTIRYETGRVVPAYLRDLGSAATTFSQIQKRDQVDLSGTYFIDRFGSHTIKAGGTYTKLQDQTATQYTGGSLFTSLAPEYSGVTFAQARDLGIFSSSEYNYVLTALRREGPGNKFFDFADANGDGTISQEEFDGLVFNSIAGNNGGVNFLRTADLQVGKNNVIAKQNVVFLQDDWEIGQLGVNLGVRMEDWEYEASDGSMILDMDPTYSPRVGLSYDLLGDGRQKVSAFYGKYYDALTTSMVHFAGNITGTVRGEQVHLADDWFTYRFRGSPVFRDAGFAPNLENQSQEEYSLTYGWNISPTLGLLIQGFRRTDRDIIEDYDPYVYFDVYGGEAGSLALTPADFGYPPEGPGIVNFFLGNLVGAKRETNGIDIAFERRFVGNWTANVQYSWRDAKGNSNSDSNADLQGDFLEIDPRQPYMWGHLPGSVDHQLKIYGMYRTPIALEIGGLLYYSSGAHYTESDIFLPGRYDIFINHQREDGSYARMGDEKHPSYFSFDTRLHYPWQFQGTMSFDLFLDIYNVLNDQDAIYVEQAYNDPEFTHYREDRTLLEPRRYQLGVRFNF